MQITLALKEEGDGGREEGRDREEGEQSKVKGFERGVKGRRGGGEKIPWSSVRSLSAKSSVCFFERGPTGPRRRRWRKTG